MNQDQRLLLISNSALHGEGYLDYCAEEIVNFLGDIKSVLFIPYALKDQDMYEKVAQERFSKMGISLTSIHKASDPLKAIAEASAIFTGGGNTFRLLKTLYDKKLIEAIRERVKGGMPYMGASAGTNIACPTIKTTNDMPIVFPPSFEALDLIPFQINPHYIAPDANTTHMGETRDQRITEYLEENDLTVVGLKEGAWLRIEQGTVSLGGKTGAKVFNKNKTSEEYNAPTKLDLNLTQS